MPKRGSRKYIGQRQPARSTRTAHEVLERVILPDLRVVGCDFQRLRPDVGGPGAVAPTGNEPLVL
jgi:hypothetical protein